MDIDVRNDRAVLQPKGELTIFEAADFREGLISLSATPAVQGAHSHKLCHTIAR